MRENIKLRRKSINEKGGEFIIFYINFIKIKFFCYLNYVVMLVGCLRGCLHQQRSPIIIINEVRASRCFQRKCDK